MVTEVESQPSTVELLLKLADVIERENLTLDYVNIGNGRVYLVESEFRKIFHGLVLTGQRNGMHVKIEAKAFGITWQSDIYAPLVVKPSIENVEVTL